MQDMQDTESGAGCCSPPTLTLSTIHPFFDSPDTPACLNSLTWTQTLYLCERVASLQVNLSFLEGAHQTDQATPMYLGHSISIDHFFSDKPYPY